MSIFGDAKPCFTSKLKPSWEIRLRTLLLRVMNNVFHVIQKSYEINFCLAIINTAIAESFGDEYKLKLNQRRLTSDNVKTLQRNQY